MENPERIPELFGSLVFNDKVMKAKLPKDIYKSLKKTIDEDAPLQIDVANVKGAIDAKDLAGDLCVRKAFDLVKENAKVTDVAPKADAE